MSVDHCSQAEYCTPVKPPPSYQEATAGSASLSSPGSSSPPLKRDLILRLQSLKLSLQEKEQQRRAIFDELDKTHYTAPDYLPLHDRRRLLSKAMLDEEYELIACERELDMRGDALILVEEAEPSREEGMLLTHSCINEAPQEEEESLIRKSEIKRLNDNLQDSVLQCDHVIEEEYREKANVGKEEANVRKSRRKVYKYLVEDEEVETGESAVRKSRAKTYKYSQKPTQLDNLISGSQAREQYLSEILQNMREEERQKQLLIHSHYRLVQ